jgi:hypothetical protein
MSRGHIKNIFSGGEYLSTSGGDVSEQMVRDGMIVAEEIAKVAGHLAKETIALIIALLKREGQSKGATPVTNLKNQALKTGQTLEIFQIKKTDIPTFKKLSKEFGVLYHKKTMPPAFLTRKTGGELVDILALSGDAPGINRVLEKMGYPVPERDDGKNAEARAASEQSSPERGSGYGRSRPKEKNDAAPARADGAAEGKKSVVSDIRRYKEQAKITNSGRAVQAPTAKPAPVRPGR